MTEIGEVRQSMAKELGESIVFVVNRKKGLPSYYILVNVEWRGDNILNTRLVILKDKPKVPMFNTMLYFIDNRNETFRQEWCLPKDPEIPERAIVLLDGSKQVEAVLRSSAKLNNALLRGMH
jgi:hypothetical protein